LIRGIHTIKLNVTPNQLNAIKELADDCSSMIGAGNYENDIVWINKIELIDAMLERNNLPKRQYG